MSLKQSTKERIKNYILEKIEDEDPLFVKKTAENFEVSLTTVYRYIKELYDAKVIKKENGNYILETKRISKSYATDITLEEDKIFDELVESIVLEFPDNVRRIWRYAFTEMMNNAIEHSNARKIWVGVWYNYRTTNICIQDDGIGIFEKIKQYYGYESLDDAVNELFKGKLTTDSENHTGEGIFFTSRMMEDFCVLSGGKIFTHSSNCDITRDVESVPVLKKYKDQQGTFVLMKLANNSKTVIREVFDMFSESGGGLTKTQIPMKNIFTDGFPVSRSQAKRLYSRFEEFEEVRLDFAGIDELGQGFAHELFVVFSRKHPEVKIIIENANDEVNKMISHVKA